MQPLGLDYPINTLNVAVGITCWEGMYDNTFLCILCIVFVCVFFFGHLHVMHDSISLHNCRNYDFLVIMEIVSVSVNSVCIQGYRIYGLILQAFYSSEYIQQVLSPIFLQYRKHSASGDGDWKEIAVLGGDSKAHSLVGGGTILS